ncbi:UPF0176 protein [Sphingomonas jinjuensis]|uniref:tRNA uridine(34) hydroxylase n=1 Tax=Sphingomonas jinjuensis TaxID=535907 RepID=A0A840F7A0_9SPHN|nr:UPF0176 protein [Sphingomonas jinjuensis]
MIELPVAVAALYRFIRIDDPAAVRERVEPLLDAAGVRGTILLAHEGINGTVAGEPDTLRGAIAALQAMPGFDALELKWSGAAAMPFGRLKVKVKAEIVTLGDPAADPTQAVGGYVAPADWNALVDDPDTIVIDTRNDYEVAIGSFAGAVDPGTPSFRDFPAWVDAHSDELAGKRVAMFCTGGIRCEKATALLKTRGIDDVLHLKGGILAYLEQVPAADSRWQGECFVFDERVAVGHGLAPGSYAMDRERGLPVKR